MLTTDTEYRRMVFAIDPGATGAIASLCASAKNPISTLSIYPFGKTRAAVMCAVRECVGSSRPFREVAVLLERAFVKPGSGVKQAMTYMEHYGLLVGALLSLQVPEDCIFELTPQQWQRHIRTLVPARAGKGVRKLQAEAAGVPLDVFAAKVQAERRKTIKTNSRTIATYLYPQAAAHFARVKDDGKADAALMAYVGLHFFTTATSVPPTLLAM